MKKFYLCDDKSINFIIGTRDFCELDSEIQDKADKMEIGGFLELGNGLLLQRYE